MKIAGRDAMSSNPTDQNQPTATTPGGASPLLPSIVLAWLGAVVSFLLLQERAGVRLLFCPSRAGCEAVFASRYASLLGVPLPWVGAAFYLAILALLLTAHGSRVAARRVRLVGFVVWLAVAGLAFSGALMWVQFRVLHALCALCTTSAVVVAALVFTTMRAERRLAAAGSSTAGAWALAGIAAIATLGLALPGIVVRDDIVAVVDGRKFSRTQMEADLASSLQPLQRSTYALEFEWAKRQINDALLASEAARRKVTVEQLLASGPAKDELLAEIAAGHRIEILLKKPPLRNLHFDLSTAQVAGPPDAKVQLVVFSDFQCDYCARLAAVLRQIREEFPREVLVAYRSFPLEAKPRSVPAAVAAECAAEQGAFWPYHDALFTNGGDLSDARLRAVAAEIGLDAEKFQACLASDKARRTVEASAADAVNLGLEGTPALFLNGTMIGGFVEHDALVRRIRQILGGQ